MLVSDACITADAGRAIASHADFPNACGAPSIEKRSHFCASGRDSRSKATGNSL